MSSMEALMERIRGKVDQQKTLLDTAKAVRIGMADKRHSLDIQDKEIFRKCLDTLQSSISVKTSVGMLEKLETIARQMKLKCIKNHQPPVYHLFITSEAFYIDIVIDAAANVMGVNIHHQVQKAPGSGNAGTVQNCPEIVECLNKQDFDSFVKHLEGFNNVYDLTCSLSDKSRAWQVLCNLEDDLMRLYKVQQSQPWVKDLNQLIHKTGLGLVEARAGGLPMKLRIFLPPYQLLDIENKKLLPMNQSTIIGKDLGMILEVGIQSSSSEHILPLTQAISSSGQDVPLASANCAKLPAYFVLKLIKPLPVSAAVIQHIETITGIPWVDKAQGSSLFSLISSQESEGALDSKNNRGLFVTLPDQQHCYFLTDTQELAATAISFVPFRHPSQVPNIVDALRRQAVFNSLIASCVRTNSLEDVEASSMFEITCVDPLCQTITVTFEDPSAEDMSTAELILADVAALKCRLYMSGLAGCGDRAADMDGSGNRTPDIESSVSRVLLQSLSIPITMRYILKKNQAKVKHIKTEVDPTGVGHNDAQPTDPEQKKGLQQGRNYPGTPSSVCDSGGKMKKEAMETDHTDSLNRYGPQGAESLPGALTITRSPTKVQFRQPLHTEHSSPAKKLKSGTKESSSSGGYSITKTELEDAVPPGISISKLPAHDKSRHHTKEDSILPLVSITPISGRDTGDQRLIDNQDNTGIQIIPLGGLAGSSDGHPKAKSRDFKRSLSEDDKRRIERKEKRRREEMKHRASVSPRREGETTRKEGETPRREGETSRDSPKSNKKGTENKTKDPKAKLAGVIERLAHQTGDSVGLEIRPSPPKDKDKKFSSLKMTFKNKDGTTSSSRYDGSSSSSSKHDANKNENKHAVLKQNHNTIKPAHKITERFITDRYASSTKKPDEKKKDQDLSKKDAKTSSEKPTVSIHIVKSPATVHGASPLHRSSGDIAEPIVEDPVIIGK